MNDRPNILIISASQHRADCLGIAGKRVKTPHLDALTESGTRFANCITPSVAAQPARASILTGQLCKTHGVHDDGLDLNTKTGEKGFSGTLSDAGYQSAFFGRANFANHHPKSPRNKPECSRSSEKYDESWFGPYMGFDHVELCLTGKHGFSPQLPPAGQHYERFFHADGQGAHRMEQYKKDMGPSTGSNTCWHSGLPLSHHSTPWTANRAIDWLRHTRDQDAPFCSWVSFPDIQHPYDCPQPWSLMHDPAHVELPDHRTLDAESLPWWYRSALSREDSNGNSVAGKANTSRQTEQVTDSELRHIIANTYGKIAFIDEQIGRLMNELSQQGLLENTHVFYIADRGDWLGEHGLTLKGPLFYDCMLRVPMIWSGPNVPENRVNYEPVSTLDLAPSVLELAGVEPQLKQHGESLSPLFDTHNKRDFAMSEWELLPGRVDATVSLRSVRTRTYKLTKDMNSSGGELYDLLADPHEQNNLFEHPNFEAIKIRLESYLKMRTHDYFVEKAA